MIQAKLYESLIYFYVQNLYNMQLGDYIYSLIIDII